MKFYQHNLSHFVQFCQNPKHRSVVDPLAPTDRCTFHPTFRKPAARNDHRGFDLISDVLPFKRLWYDGPRAASNAVSYAMHSSRSHDAVIRVYDDTGNVIETHEHAGDFVEP